MAVNDRPPGPSKSKKGDLESRVARGQLRASWAQTAIAALAFFIAIWAAYTGQQAISVSNQAAARQSADSQLSDALADIKTVAATGEGAITGLVVLEENTVDRVVNNDAGEPPAEVYAYYSSALQIFAGYLSSYDGAKAACPESVVNAMCFGRGWGPPPPLPLTISTAANQLQLLLTKKLQDDVTALKAGQSTINLSDDELAGQQWPGINFGWIQATLMNTDLRGTDLEYSQWSSNSDLSHSYLQCADLQNAVLQGANLNGADLRGANIQAQISEAHRSSARLSHHSTESPNGPVRCAASPLSRLANGSNPHACRTPNFGTSSRAQAQEGAQAPEAAAKLRSCVPLGVMICGSLPSTSARNRVLPEAR